VQGGVSVDDRRSTDVLGIKQDWVLESGRHVMKWGFDFKRLRASYRYASSPVDETAPPSTEDRSIVQDPSGSDTAAYIADELRVHPLVDLELGVRAGRETYTDSDDGYVSPRANLLVQVDSRTVLRLGWGYFHQPQRINELQVEDGIEVYFPVQRAEHQTLRLERLFGRTTHLRVGLYRKRLTDLRPRFENLFNPVSLAPEVAPDRVGIDPSRGEILGMELGLSGRGSRRLDWWASYVLSSAEDEIEGASVPRAWDQRHAFDFGLAYEWKAWQFGMIGAYHSGRPTTPVTAQASFPRSGDVEYVLSRGPYNGARLPAYGRLDLHVARKLTPHGSTGEVYLDVTNLLDRENVCCVTSFDTSLQTDGSVAVQPVQQGVRPRKVAVGTSWTF
jgi:outer membrane receptor protein involved in Fe transport